jgi:hypothetical protein
LLNAESKHEQDGRARCGEERDVHEVKWLPEPEQHDCPAAASYLSLVAEPRTVESLLAALPPDNPHVVSDLVKIDKGRPLSPVLLVRDTG